MTGTNSPAETDFVEEQPINLINRVSEQFLSQGRHVSPILNAIQELSGTQPGEKYRMINQVVKIKIKKDAKPKEPNLEVPDQILDFVSTKVDIELKSVEAIIRCLKSEDKTLVTQAFKAKWFFNHTNPNLNVDFFTSFIIPFASEYTCLRIIKTLSRCLVNAPKVAEDFYTIFARIYGVNIALPLLTACSEDFIYNEIMKNKLILSHDILLTISKRCPAVVVRYLNLGHSKNKKNDEARSIHVIYLSDYHKFIPHLIRIDIEYFIELIESYEWLGCDLKIGSTLTSLFFKKAIDVFLEKPTHFIQIWPIKVVSKKLTVKQYETMYFNLFPKTINDFRSTLSKMIEYLKGYPSEKRYHLISSQFKLKYQKDFSESIENIQVDELNEIYDHLSVELYEKLCIQLFPEEKLFRADDMLDKLSKYPKEKRLNLLMETYKLKYEKNLLDDLNQVRLDNLLVLLPSDLKIYLAKKILELCEIKSTEYYNNYYLLPLSECFPIYKEVIQKSSEPRDRFLYIEKMIKSCELYNNMEDLLQVIKYYSMRHANEKIDIFIKFLSCIECQFDLKTFGEEHWVAILELFQKLSVRGEFSKVSHWYLQPYFGAAVYYVHSIETIGNRQSLLTKLYNLLIDCNIDRVYSDQMWNFSDKYLSVQKVCFDALLPRFPTKYPPEHHIWKQNSSIKKLNIVIAILQAINKYHYNIQEQGLIKKYQKSDIREYPWLLNMTKELFDSGDALPWFDQLKKSLKKHSTELYNSFTGNYALDIKSGSAWIKLKKNYSEVMVHWPSYLNQCREILQKNSKRGGAAAKRFLLSIKWYNSLPIYFVKQCLKELNVPGSLKVLAILLDSEVFTSLATAFAPIESITTYQNAKDYFALVKDIPPAINFANPPVSFDVIIMYCQGNYTQLAVQTFEHTTHLVSKEKIINFADNLVSKPVSVKKHGIRLFFKAAPTEELRSFVRNLMILEKNPSIRELICTVCQNRLIKLPTAENWSLVQICISALTVQDEACLNLLSDVTKMKNEFVHEYVAEFIKKIDELSTDPEFPEAVKIQCICKLLSKFTFPVIKYLPEKIILQLLEKYYFDTDSLEISAAVQSFATKIFSKQYLQRR